ncbi:hypothetical protein [Streptomyces sp. IBSBF 2806]
MAHTIVLRLGELAARPDATAPWRVRRIPEHQPQSRRHVRRVR